MFTDTITRYVATVSDQTDALALLTVLKALGDRYSSVATSSAGLVIKAGGSTLAKIGATAYQGLANGIPVTIAAATDMPVLTGTITANSFNVYCFFVDSASAVTVAQGTEGTTLAKVVFPQFPVGKALVGYLIVTHSATFTGGTTALDTATTNYVSPTGAFEPAVIP